MTSLTIIVSVDWEGRSLLEENRTCIRGFRERHPDVPFQHFLNPAYYTRGKGRSVEIDAFINDAVADGDECGLHVHAWRSLVEAAGVEVQREPKFIDNRVEVPKAGDDWGFFPPEDGYDVPLETYDSRAIAAILETSRQILVDHGFPVAPSFRAGGWMSGPNVRAALAAQNFRHDCSPVNPQLAIRRFGDMPLCRWLSELWPDVVETSQPRLVRAGPGYLWEVPDNGGLIDYTPIEDFAAIVKANIDAALAENRPMILVTGFHQETARTFLPRLEEALDQAEGVASECDVALSYAADMAAVITRLNSEPGSNA